MVCCKWESREKNAKCIEWEPIVVPFSWGNDEPKKALKEIEYRKTHRTTKEKELGTYRNLLSGVLCGLSNGQIGSIYGKTGQGVGKFINKGLNNKIEIDLSQLNQFEVNQLRKLEDQVRLIKAGELGVNHEG